MTNKRFSVVLVLATFIGLLAVAYLWVIFIRWAAH